MNALLLLCLAAAQESPEAALFKKCDSEIPWITDGTDVLDLEPGAGGHPIVEKEPRNFNQDRGPLFAKAREQAAAKKRLILWYCPRIPGSHMYRTLLLDKYLKVVVFTDPGVVDLVKTKFVPVRMYCDKALSTSTGIKRWDFVEPGLVFMTPEGKVVHTLDRIRTFNADWFRAALVEILRKFPEYNAPAGETAEDLIKGGDDEKALAKASPEQKALIHRRLGRWDKVEGSPLQRGLASLNQKKFGDARKLLEGIDSAEARYYLAIVDHWTAKDPLPRLKEVVARHPDTRWAWRAASNLVMGKEDLPDGPLLYHFEDFFAYPNPGAATSTCRPNPDFNDVVKRAVEFLLQTQAADGSWKDTRYNYWPAAMWPNTKVKTRQHVIQVSTSLAALALSEWREVDPARIDKAVARADKYIVDPANMNLDNPYQNYSNTYRLLYLAHTKNVPRMNEAVRQLAAQQDGKGAWAHDYSNPFLTAVVVHSLAVAKKAGADVPEPLFQRAAPVLAASRGDGGTMAYGTGGKPTGEKDSMARVALADVALFDCGQVGLDRVASAVDFYWKYAKQLEAVRVCDAHADGILAGFMFFHSTFHTVEGAVLLQESRRKEHLKAFRAQMLSVPEFDGSFIDSHELGKAYGTAFALLILNRTR